MAKVITCAVICAILLSSNVSGYSNLFIDQQDIELTIPFNNKSFHIMEAHPIIQLKFTEMKGDKKTAYKFTLKNSPDFLTIKESTGEIYFHRNKWFKHKLAQTSVEASLENLENKSSAKTQLTLNFVAMNQKKFCLKYSCFYDHVRYLTSEFNVRKGSEEQIIGALNPLFYSRLCNEYKTVYFIENGIEYVDLSKMGHLTKERNLDFENLTNPNLIINMTCELRDKLFKVLDSKWKLFDITVKDRNDNNVYLDEEFRKFEIYRHEINFTEGDLVNRSNVIIFRDLDSLEANNQVEIKMFDEYKMFQHECTPTTWHDPDKNLTASAFVCDIKFSITGQLNQSRYCFNLKAFDVSNKKKPHATSHICVHTSIDKFAKSSIQASVEITTLESTHFVYELIYPEVVELLQSVSYMARVTQPLTNTEEGGFVLTLNPFNAFNITATGGIIYVVQPNLLAQALPASIIKLEVSWKEHRRIINILLKQDTTRCNDLSERNEDFCARHENQISCESSCGVGSTNSRCQWRSHQGFELISNTFATCVSDLDFCADSRCDPLEHLGSLFNYQICPQDCSQQVFGNVNSKPMGISSSSKSNICTCNEHGECVCGPPVTTTLEILPSTTSTTITTSTYPIQHPVIFDTCGSECMALIIGVSCIGLLTLVSIVSLLYFVFREIRDHRLRAFSIESCNDSEKKINVVSPAPSKFEVICETPPLQGYPDFYSRQWELDIKKVTIQEVIGEGEFGKVMLANLRDHKGRSLTTVAIKTVKDATNDSEMISLKKEFEQLQKVSIRPHQNVITLLGCCSKGLAPFIVLEYCVYESLKDYLLASRLIKMRSDSDSVDKVTTFDVIKFSHQICKGMSHLAELKLVHRDLAARNVLLGERKICKISDFGLTRNVCNSCDMYSKCSNDKVPIKWLAPESLSATEDYTTKSDVWSFGILGYELLTLGGAPYPGIAVNQLDLLYRLEKGYRMERPANCSEQLFEIYQSCWAYEPSKRPTFDELSKKFEELNAIMCAASQSHYNVPLHMWNTPEFSDDEWRVYDKMFYLKYIERINKARAAFKAYSNENRQSSDEELLKSQPAFQHNLRPSASFSFNKSLTQNNNDRYNRAFNTMRVKKMQQNEDRDMRNQSNRELTDESGASSNCLLHYLPVEPCSLSNLQSPDNSRASSIATLVSDSGYMKIDDMKSSMSYIETDF